METPSCISECTTYSTDADGHLLRSATHYNTLTYLDGEEHPAERRAEGGGDTGGRRASEDFEALGDVAAAVAEAVQPHE